MRGRAAAPRLPGANHRAGSLREPQVRATIASQVGTDGTVLVLAADLRSDEGWEQAVQGCDYVLHVASPFPPAQPKDPDELIVPAREGTLRVLRAALAAGRRRSSSPPRSPRSAAAPRPPRPLTEEDWTDLDHQR